VCYSLPGKRITVIVWSAPVVQPCHGHCYWTLKRICFLWISWSKRHWSGIVRDCVLCGLRSIVWFVCMFCIVCFFWVVLCLCILCIFNLSSVLYFL